MNAARFRFLCGLLVSALALSPGLALCAATEMAATEFSVGGLKVLLKPRPSAQTVSIGIFFAGPRAGLTAETAGIEPLLLETMTLGSEHFPREALRAELSRRAMALSSASNLDYSVLSIGCTLDNFDQAFAIIADAAMHPALTETDFVRTRTRLAAAADAAIGDADSQLNRVVEDGIYAGHPYAARSSGTAATLGAVTLTQLRAYHHRLLEAANLRLVIVGNVDPVELRQKVKAGFAGLPPGDSPEDVVPPLRFDRSSFHRAAREMRLAYVKGVFAAPRLEDRDAPAFRLMLNLLRDRLFQKLRVERNLSYSPLADLSLSAAPYGYVYFSTASVEEAARLCLAEANGLKTELVSAVEIKAQRNGLLTAQYVNQETNADQAGELARAELIGGGWRNHSAANAYETVTPEDIRQAARKWLTHFQFFLLGPASMPVDETSFREPPLPPG